MGTSSERDFMVKSQGKPVSLLWVWLFSFIFLIFSHLAVKAFSPNPVSWIFAITIMIFIGIGWMVLNGDDFGFFLIIFLCGHFVFADNQGGVFPYVFFVVIVSSMLMIRRKIVVFSSVPFIFHVILLVFFIHQVIGTILNPYSLASKIQFIVLALSWVLVFYYAASLKISDINIKRFLFSWFAIVIWMFIAALNQKYHWVITLSPLLSQHEMNLSAYGTFECSELFSEYSCYVFVFSLIILCNLREFKVLKIKKSIILPVAFISLCNLIMGVSRASLLLAGVSVFYIIFLNVIVIPSGKNFRQALIVLAVLPVLVVLVLQLGSLVSTDLMKEDFQKLSHSKLNIKTAISGRGIHRGNLFISAVEKLRKESRWLGYGYSKGENNLKTMGLEKRRLKGYHNLYLSLPFYFGWGGAVMFILLVFGTGLRSYLTYFRLRKLNHYLVSFALGFAMLWGIFIVNQYKISLTRSPSYFFLIWMLLGFTHAIVNSSKEVDIHKTEIE